MNRGQFEVFVGKVVLCDLLGALLAPFEIVCCFMRHLSVAVRLKDLRDPSGLRVLNVKTHMASARLGGSGDALSQSWVCHLNIPFPDFLVSIHQLD
jgi:hypothetical protein